MCLHLEIRESRGGGHIMLAADKTWWRNYFKDLESEGVLDSSSELSMGCIWYCFAHILQEDLDNVREHWNSHRIRKSKQNTVPGQPDSLFFLPEHHGAVGNLLHRVLQSEICSASI